MSHGLPIVALGSQASGFKENKYKYQSNEYNKELGLNWMNFHARQYDPQIGRFLSIDPLANRQGQQVLSPYAAMGNAPESLIDPNGTSAYISDFGAMSRSEAEYVLTLLFGKDNFSIDQGGMITLKDPVAALANFNSWVAANAGGAGGATYDMFKEAGEAILAYHSPDASQDVFVDFNNDISHRKMIGALDEVTVGPGPGWWKRLNDKIVAGIRWLDSKTKGSTYGDRNDKVHDEDGGGIQWTSTESHSEEGRSVGHPDKESENFDDMGFLFNHGGSGGLGFWSRRYDILSNWANTFDYLHQAGHNMGEAAEKVFNAPPAYKIYITQNGRGVGADPTPGADTSGMGAAIQRALDSLSRNRK